VRSRFAFGAGAIAVSLMRERSQIFNLAFLTSNQAFMINGASVQVHWFRNIQTLQDVEFKFKRQYPKTAPKNQ
jgi:hypothetical protein